VKNNNHMGFSKSQVRLWWAFWFVSSQLLLW